MFEVRFSWVSITPFAKPVVPLEYGSATRSFLGSISTSGALPSLFSNSAKGVAPSASPRTKISSMPHSSAAGDARSINCGIVINIFAPESLNWCTKSFVEYKELTVVLIPPTAATPRKIVAYSGQLGQNTAHTSPFLKPR